MSSLPEKQLSKCCFHCRYSQKCSTTFVKCGLPLINSQNDDVPPTFSDWRCAQNPTWWVPIKYLTYITNDGIMSRRLNTIGAIQESVWLGLQQGKEITNFVPIVGYDFYNNIPTWSEVEQVIDQFAIGAKSVKDLQKHIDAAKESWQFFEKVMYFYVQHPDFHKTKRTNGMLTCDAWQPGGRFKIDTKRLWKVSYGVFAP